MNDQEEIQALLREIDELHKEIYEAEARGFEQGFAQGQDAGYAQGMLEAEAGMQNDNYNY